jgi:hypothetical protein
MKASSLSLAAFFALFICSCNTGDKVLLRLELNANKRIDLKYRTSVFSDSENGTPLRNEYIRMTMRVDRILPDSSYQLKAKVDFIRVIDPKLLGNEEYTSDKDVTQLSAAGRQLDEQLTPVVDSLYQFAIDKQGKITQPISFAGGQEISPQYTLIDLNIFQPSFPANSVAVGEEWNIETDLPGTIYKRKSTYQIENVYENTIQIKVDGNIDGELNDAKTFSGRYYLNKANCNLDSCRIEVKSKAGEKGKTVIALAVK